MFPAQAGTQTLTHSPESIIWIPAFAGNADKKLLLKQGPFPSLGDKVGLVGQGPRQGLHFPLKQSEQNNGPRNPHEPDHHPDQRP